MKEKFSVSIDENLLKWLDGEIKTKRFASRSHGIEFALMQLKKEWIQNYTDVSAYVAEIPVQFHD